MQIHTVHFTPEDWMLLTQQLSQLDRFDARWQGIERREAQTLKELKSIATVRSVGASTRIEGSRLSDPEVKILIENLDISKLTERDQQEVIGYYDVLNLITEAYREMPVSENTIKHLHNALMKHSTKDGYHKGDYKINHNRVERTEADGSRTTIFETTAPGWQTQDAMTQLVKWYNDDSRTHPLIRVAIFIYDFLSIHPFQDGNGRLSRLLTSLLLMKSGYVWIEYVSFEHEVEHRKKEYYVKLMDAQRNRPGENVTEWVMFFLDCLNNIQQQLLHKLKEKQRRETLGTREQQVYTLIENNPGISSGQIAARLSMASSTVKKILADHVSARNLVVHGVGRATTYSIAASESIKTDLVIKLTNDERSRTITLPQLGSFLRIKKIILIPLFAWTHPNEWDRKLSENGLIFTIRASTADGSTYEQPYIIDTYIDPYQYQPVFLLHPNIVLPDQLMMNNPVKARFPINCTIELSGSVTRFDFDVMLITDEA